MIKLVSFYSDVPFPEEQTIGLDSFIFNSCGTNVGKYDPIKEECISYYESLGMYHLFLFSLFVFTIIIIILIILSIYMIISCSRRK